MCFNIPIFVVVTFTIFENSLTITSWAMEISLAPLMPLFPDFFFTAVFAPKCWRWSTFLDGWMKSKSGGANDDHSENTSILHLSGRSTNRLSIQFSRISEVVVIIMDHQSVPVRLSRCMLKLQLELVGSLIVIQFNVDWAWIRYLESTMSCSFWAPHL